MWSRVFVLFARVFIIQSLVSNHPWQAAPAFRIQVDFSIPVIAWCSFFFHFQPFVPHLWLVVQYGGSEAE